MARLRTTQYTPKFNRFHDLFAKMSGAHMSSDETDRDDKGSRKRPTAYTITRASWMSVALRKVCRELVFCTLQLLLDPLQLAERVLMKSLELGAGDLRLLQLRLQIGLLLREEARLQRLAVFVARAGSGKLVLEGSQLPVLGVELDANRRKLGVG